MNFFNRDFLVRFSLIIIIPLGCIKSKYHFKFEDLWVFQKAIDFAALVDSTTKGFLQRELYALGSQYRRASNAIGLNITEGYPGSDAQFVKHINHGLHSSNECVCANEKALRRNYVHFEQSEEVRSQITTIQKMLTSLRSKIKVRIDKK
jgi:four helix bundle protein